MKLHVVEKQNLDRDITSVVCKQADVLHDLTIRAVNTTKADFRQALEQAIAESKALTSSVNLSEVEEKLNQENRPATSQEIKRQLQILIGSFPNSGKNDLAIYGLALLEDVSDERPSIAALTTACRIVRRNNNFVPTINEVLVALSLEMAGQNANLVRVRDLPQRIKSAEVALHGLIERRLADFPRMVRFCESRIACGGSHGWFDPDVIAEARRRLKLDSFSDAECSSNQRRLASLLTAPQMPKRETGWNKESK